MQITGKVNENSLRAFENGLNFYVGALGKDAVETMNKYSAILFKDIMSRTPPVSYGDADLSPKKTGEQAVKRDVRKVYDLIDYSTFNSPTIQKLIRKRDYEAINNIVSNAKAEFKKLKNKQIVPFNPQDVERQRTRAGSISRGVKPNKATMDKKELNDYIKRKIGNVGLLRASVWAAGKLFGVKAPSWVASKEAKARQFVSIQNDIETPKHSFRYENHIRTIGRLTQFVNFSLKLIADKMKKDLQFKVNYAAKKAGYSKVEVKL